MLTIAVVVAFDDGQHLHHHIGLLPQHRLQMTGDERRSGILQLLWSFEPDQLHKRKTGFDRPAAYPAALDPLQGDKLGLAAGQGAQIRQQGRAYLLQGIDGDGPKTKMGHGKPLGCDE